MYLKGNVRPSLQMAEKKTETEKIYILETPFGKQFTIKKFLQLI